MTFPIRDFHSKITGVEENELNEGEQILITFTNGWKASVVRGPYTYGGPNGLWEFGVFNPDGHLDYENPVTPDDVEGSLTEVKVAEKLRKLAHMTEDVLHEYRVEKRRRDYVETLSHLNSLIGELDAFDTRIISELPFDLRKASKAIRFYFDGIADVPEETEDDE